MRASVMPAKCLGGGRAAPRRDVAVESLIDLVRQKRLQAGAVAVGERLEDDFIGRRARR